MKTGILVKNRESGGFFFLSNQRTYQSLQESERGDPTKIRLQGGAAERRRADVSVSVSSLKPERAAAANT